MRWRTGPLIVCAVCFYLAVLGPITSVANLKLNMNPELDTPAFEVPKVDLYLEVEKLAVGITRAQYLVRQLVYVEKNEL